METRTRELIEANMRLQELDIMKDRFIRTVSHELRTPVTSILGYLEIIQGTDCEVPEAIKRLLMVVDRNAKRLKTITDDFLFQQRIESGGLEIIPQMIHLEALVYEVQDELEPVFESKSQSLEFYIMDNLPHVRADPVRISQVIVNLLSNASKFSSEKSRIRLRLVNEQDSLRLSVEDDGIGLDPADVEKLFKPFPNIIRPTVTEKSIGLGLSICKGYLDLHGGRIWVESDGRGQGSTFNFTLPLALS